MLLLITITSSQLNNFRTQISRDRENGRVQQFYPVKDYDWYLEDYEPPKEWFLPPSIYRNRKG